MYEKENMMDPAPLHPAATMNNNNNCGGHDTSNSHMHGTVPQGGGQVTTSNGFRTMNGHPSRGNHAGSNQRSYRGPRGGFLPDHIPISPALAGSNNYHPHSLRNGDSGQPSERTSTLYHLDTLNGDLMPLYQTTPWVKQIYSSPPVLGLHQEINDFYDFIKPIEEEEFMRNRVVSRIEEIVLRLWPNAKVEIFGSFATKLYLPTSDIDLMIMGKWDVTPLHTLKNELIKAEVANEDDIKVLDKASVPIVKVIDKETEVRVDISFNTSNGVNSANLIKVRTITLHFLPTVWKVCFNSMEGLFQQYGRFVSTVWKVCFNSMEGLFLLRFNGMEGLFQQYGTFVSTETNLNVFELVRNFVTSMDGFSFVLLSLHSLHFLFSLLSFFSFLPLFCQILPLSCPMKNLEFPLPQFIDRQFSIPFSNVSVSHAICHHSDHLFPI